MSCGLSLGLGLGGGAAVCGVEGMRVTGVCTWIWQGERTLKTEICVALPFIIISHGKQHLPTSGLNNYCPSLSQSCNSLPSLALFKNNGPKFRFSPRSLLDAFTVLTSVWTAGSKEIQALYGFNCSPHLALINLLTHKIPWEEGARVGKHLNSFVLTFQHCYS